MFVKVIHVLRMEESVLKSHMKGEKYKRNSGILGLSEKKKPSAPDRSQTYDLPISTSDALPLSYRRLVVARPLLIVQLPVQLRCLHFYTKKLVQVVTNGRSLVLIVQKRILTNFLFPASAGSRWSINCQAY